MHSHEEIQITLPQANTKILVDCELASRKYFTQSIKAGEAFLISPNQKHTLEWQQPGELTLFYLHPHFLAHAVNESIEKKQLRIDNCLKPIDDFMLREIGFIFRNLSTLGFEHEKLYIESLANLLAIHLLKNYFHYSLPISSSAPELSIKRFQQIEEYIEANLSEKITLADLAQIANLGKFYFSHLFKRYTNMSPYDYVLQLRIKRAQELLQSSNIAICDIALECGFSNQSHFTKHFRKKLNITPMNYRKTHQRQFSISL